MYTTIIIILAWSILGIAHIVDMVLTLSEEEWMKYSNTTRAIIIMLPIYIVWKILNMLYKIFIKNYK